MGHTFEQPYNGLMQLTTARLLLRDLRESDFPDLRAFESDPEVQRFEGPPLPEADTRWRLEGAIEWAQEQPRIRYKLGITVPPADQVIGRISLSLKNEAAREWEIGWTLRRADWGKGYATEAAQAVLAYAFKTLHARRVVALCQAENAASMRVIQKLGMQPEDGGRQTRWLNNGWHDELVFAIHMEDDQSVG